MNTKFQFKLRVIIALFLLISLNFKGQVFTKITAGPVVNEANNSYFATWGDYDKDGDIDLFHSLFFAAVNNPLGNNLMFQNNCNGNFTKISQIPGGLVNDGLTGAYSYWIDFDNDGDLDLYVGPKFLYQNQGNGGFIKVNKTITTAIPPYPLYAEIGVASWADYDNDGYLDVFFGKQEIHRNNQNGDWTQLNIPPFTSSDPNAGVGGISWADYNNDGYMDAFVACVGDNVGQPTPNHLYRNLGNGSFVDETANTSMINTRSYGACWVDYDNDLDMDLFINGTFGGNDKLFTNNGNGTFTEVLTGPIVANNIINQAGGAWADYDNDGDIDLYVTNFNQNVLYDNNGNGTFTQNTTEIVVNDTPVESYGAAWADYDNDGDLDLFVPTAFGDPNDNLYKNNVYQNNTANSSWLKLHCNGVLSNRDAIGARVYVKATINSVSRWQMREVNANSTRGGESGGASGHVVHFGLGNATIIDSLKIVWPKSGITQVFTNVNINRFLEIFENSNTLADVVACTPDVPIANPGFVTGKVYNDVNANCVFDAGIDFPIANKEVKAEPGAYFAFTDENGNYSLSLPDGTYSVSLNQQNDYITLQSCQTNSVYAVNVIASTTQSNKDFASSMSTLPCSGMYSVAITSNGITQGPCPAGQLLTSPCPGYCHQYSFLVTNGSTAPSPANSILAINFPAGFQITTVSSACAIVPGPLGTNQMNITMVNPIGVGNSCLVTVTVCLQASVPPATPFSPYVISGNFNSPGPLPGTNLLVNPDFTAGWTGFGSAYTQQCLPPAAQTAFVGPSPTPCIFGWGGPPQTGPNFFWANGAIVANQVAYSQVVPVSPNTMYQFNGWFANIIRDGIARPNPLLQVRINGTPLFPNTLLFQTIYTPPPYQPINWVNVMRAWCSGTATTANLEILSLSIAAPGNDFGIDNLSFLASSSPTTVLTQTTSCSCDPNNKIVMPAGCGPNGNVNKNENLTYTIRFQNKGTGPATNVLLSDELDSDLDVGALRILSSSHNITSTQIIPNNKLIIKFDGINLPAEGIDPVGSNGFVVINISPKPGLPDGTVITNQTGIYFDQNEVVLTEVTKNTLYDKPYPEALYAYKHNCTQTGYVYDFTYTGGTPDNASYYWEFEDGTPSTSTQQNPTGIIFSNNLGYKNVKLIVSRNGCTDEVNDTLQVVSGLSDNGNKVTVCHNGNLISVSINALAAHLAHGDCIGECSSGSANRFINNASNDASIAMLFDVDIMPNPSNSECFIKLSGVSNNKENVKIEVANSLGQHVAELYNSPSSNNEIQIRFETKNLSSGLYFIKTTYAGQISFKKLVIEH